MGQYDTIIHADNLLLSLLLNRAKGINVTQTHTQTHT